MRKYKNAKSIGKHACNHKFAFKSIYKIKNNRSENISIFTKPNKIIRLYHIKHIVVSGLSLDAHAKN